MVPNGFYWVAPADLVAPEYRMEEIEVTPGCPGAGRPLADIAGSAIIAALHRPEGELVPQPSGNTVLEPGDVLIAMGTASTMDRLEALLAAQGASPAARSGMRPDSSEIEKDARPCPRQLGHGTCDLPRPDHPYGPLTLDHRQMVDRVIRHQLERGRERRGRDDRNRLARDPLSRPRFARVNAAGERAQQIARGEDADQATEVGHDRRSNIALAHPLGDLAQRVLRRDDEHLGRHDLGNRRVLPVAFRYRLAQRESAASGLRARELVWPQLDLDGNGARRGRGRLRLAGSGEPCEERRQVATDDLRRRPPQRLEAPGRRPAVAAAHLMPEVARRPAGEQQSAQYGPERMGLGDRTQIGGDRLGRGVGLLRGDPALLDRETRHVAGGKDVSETGDAALLVGDDEPVAGVRDPVACLRRIDVCVERDAALVEELLGSRARGAAEELERLFLRRHQRDLYVRDAARRDVRPDQ